MYTWLPLNSKADLQKLKDHISTEYAPDVIGKRLEGGISDAVKAVLIEHNYVDKDYRSTFYNFYSKKGQRYRPDCVRLHFFDDTVSYSEKTQRLTLSDPNETRLTDHYYGYMILRPTGIATVGRTVISPDIRIEASWFNVFSEHRVHLLGYEFSFQGYPWMEQHVDISVCAHATCWSILRHYSEKYNSYREILLHDITIKAHEFNPGGIVPSQGLRISHAERVFQEAGTFPVIVARRRQDPGDPIDESFYRQLAAYVDSGFPLFAAMHKKSHAVAVIGYDWRTPVNTQVAGLRYSWDEIEWLGVIDDQNLPYLRIPVTGGTQYSAHDIDTFIVAFPEKIYYSAKAVERIAPKLFTLGTDLGLDLPPQEESIIRYFLTTGSELRKFVRDKESEFDSNLIQAIMSLPFAQFIWVIEFATEKQWAVNLVAGRAIIDATASLREPMPLWLFHSTKLALVFDRATVNPALADGNGAFRLADLGHSGFSRMATNLRPTQPKS